MRSLRNVFTIFAVLVAVAAFGACAKKKKKAGALAKTSQAGTTTETASDTGSSPSAALPFETILAAHAALDFKTVTEAFSGKLVVVGESQQVEVKPGQEAALAAILADAGIVLQVLVPADQRAHVDRLAVVVRITVGGVAQEFFFTTANATLGPENAYFEVVVRDAPPFQIGLITAEPEAIAALPQYPAAGVAAAGPSPGPGPGPEPGPGLGTGGDGGSTSVEAPTFALKPSAARTNGTTFRIEWNALAGASRYDVALVDADGAVHADQVVSGDAVAADLAIGGVTDGAYTIEVVATLAGAAVVGAGSPRALTIDRTPPEIVLTGLPAQDAADMTPTYSVDVGGSADLTEYRFALVERRLSSCADASFGDWTPKGTKIAIEPIIIGPYFACFKARDDLGNETVTDTLRRWVWFEPRTSLAMQISSALLANNAVYVWGLLGAAVAAPKAVSLANLPSGDRTIVDLAAYYHNGNRILCLLSALGNIACGGAGGSSADAPVAYDVTSVPVGHRRFVQLASSQSSFCAINDRGEAFCAGANARGEFCDQEGSGPSSDSLVAFARPGEFAGKEFRMIRGGVSATCALMAEGKTYRKVVCCGGDGGPFAYGVPVNLDAINGDGGIVERIAVGQRHACALTDTGVAACWGGSNMYHGDGTRNADYEGRSTATAVDASGLPASRRHFDRVEATAGYGAMLRSTDAERTWTSWGEAAELPNAPTTGDVAKPSESGDFSYLASDFGGPLTNIGSSYSGNGGSTNCAATATKILCWGYGDSNGVRGDNDFGAATQTHSLSFTAPFQD